MVRIFPGGGADAPGRGIGCGKIRELYLQRLEFPHETVILGVGDLGGVELVVAPVVVKDDRREVLHRLRASSRFISPGADQASPWLSFPDGSRAAGGAVR